MTRSIVPKMTAGLLLLCSPLAFSDAALTQPEFVVTGDKIINPAFGSEFVRISERLPVTQLKRRFSKYNVRSTAGEGCLICAVISRGSFGFQVNYDEDGIVVTQIFCRGSGCVDALGNKPGSSLRRALGQQAKCDAGEETTCESIRLSGLSYIVREDEKCQLRVPADGKQTAIPACVVIDGFTIYKQ